MEYQSFIRMIFLINLTMVTFLAAYSEIYLNRLYNIRPKHVKRYLRDNKTQFDEKEKWLILQMHNAYRSLVEPPATDMKEMFWDDDLEEVIRNHVQSCSLVHSPTPRNYQKKWTSNVHDWEWFRNMGENLYYSFDPYYAIEEIVWMFWREGQYYNYYRNTCASKEECSHYRVLVTNDNWRVGCAIKACRNGSTAGYPSPITYFGCIYNGAYTGNSKPYTTGRRASDCTPQKMKYNHKMSLYGLCTGPSQFYGNQVGFDGNTSWTGITPFCEARETAARTAPSMASGCQTAKLTTLAYLPALVHLFFSQFVQ